MVWRAGSRIHAFVHGLFRPSEAELVREQYEQLADQFRALGIDENAGRQHLIGSIAEDVADHFSIDSGHAQSDLIHDRVQRLFDYEGLFKLPEIDWTQERTIAELWETRAINQQYIGALRLRVGYVA